MRFNPKYLFVLGLAIVVTVGTVATTRPKTVQAQSTTNLLMPVAAWRPTKGNVAGDNLYCPVLGGADRHWWSFTWQETMPMATFQPTAHGSEGNWVKGPGEGCFDGTSTTANCDVLEATIPGQCWGGYVVPGIGTWGNDIDGTTIKYPRMLRFYGRNPPYQDLAGSDQPNDEGTPYSGPGVQQNFSIAFIGPQVYQNDNVTPCTTGTCGYEAQEVDNCVWYWHAASAKYIRMTAAAVNETNCGTGLCTKFCGYTSMPINSPAP